MLLGLTLRVDFPDDVTLCYASFWFNFRSGYSSCKIIEFMQIEFFHQTTIAAAFLP
jgi:hypothetical protein